jgi:hypothetical protein
MGYPQSERYLFSRYSRGKHCARPSSDTAAHRLDTKLSIGKLRNIIQRVRFLSRL